MPDNYVTNPGSGGSTFASDDISGVMYPRVKVSAGRDNIVADVGTGFRVLSAASTNASSIKAAAGTLYTLVAVNTASATRYLKLYDKASAPSVGTDTPKHTFALLPSGGIALSIPFGIDFTTGIALAITVGAADSDTAAVGANEVTVNGSYV